MTSSPEQEATGEAHAKAMRRDARMMTDESLTKTEEMMILAVLAQRTALRHQMTRTQVFEELGAIVFPTDNVKVAVLDTSVTTRHPATTEEATIIGEVAPADGDTVLFVGKHKGRTFQWVEEGDPSYLKWVLTNIDKGSHPQMADLRSWATERYEIVKSNKSDPANLMRKSDGMIMTGTMAGRAMTRRQAPTETAPATPSSTMTGQPLLLLEPGDEERASGEANLRRLVELQRSSTRP